eukprot:240942_1
MPIIYSLVARSTHVLAEYTSGGLTGNFSTVTRVLLNKIPDEDGRMSYVYDSYVFHYLVSDELTYLCMADEEFGRVIPFNMLEDIKNRFVATYGDRGKTAIAFAMNADFGRVLQKQTEYYNSPERDKIAVVKEEINQVKNIMFENIDKVLERGDKIELLVDKTDRLDEHAFRFKKRSRRLKNAMWWKNLKMGLLLVFIVLIVIYFILSLACGGLSIPNCR